MKAAILQSCEPRLEFGHLVGRLVDALGLAGESAKVGLQRREILLPDRHSTLHEVRAPQGLLEPGRQVRDELWGGRRHGGGG